MSRQNHQLIFPLLLRAWRHFTPLALLLAAALWGVTACGGPRARANMTTEERLAFAMKLFQDKDYFEARTQFRIITLNAPGSAIVDQAQYHLAECHFHMDEFITAAAEYEKMLRLYPRSEYLDDAQFRIGLCYYKLSPKSDLDQKYTWKAAEELQKFLEDYPESPLNGEALRLLQQTRAKLARKEFNTAELYRKMSYYEAALLYFGELLSNYYDTKYAEPALFRRAEILYKLARYPEAREAVFALMDKYRRDAQKPGTDKPKYQARAEALLKSIELQLGTNGTVKQ